MNKILCSLVISTVLSSPFTFAEDTLHATMIDGKQRVEFTLNGNTQCVMVDDKIFCTPGAVQAPVKVAWAASN